MKALHKKLLSVALAASLCFGMGVASFADDGGYGDNNGSIVDSLDSPRNAISSSVLKISGDNILGLGCGTTVENLLKNLDDTELLTVKRNNVLLESEDILCSGDTVIKTINSEETDTKTVALLGDAVGRDGKVTVADLTAVISTLTKTSAFTALGQASADCNADGKLTVSDAVEVRNLVLLNSRIEATEMKQVNYSTADIKAKTKLQGRTYDLDTAGIAVDFTSSGLEFEAICEGDVSLKMTAYSGTPKFRATVDGIESDILTISNGEIKIAQGLKKGLHSFKIAKANSHNGGKANLTGISLKGELYEKPEDKPVIEFIGDSISCAMGSVIQINDPDQGINYTDYDGKITRVMVAYTPTAGGETKRFDIDDISGKDGSYSANVEGVGTTSFSDSTGTVNWEFYFEGDELGAPTYSLPFSVGSNLSDKTGKISYTEDGTRSFAKLTADKLGYDYKIFCESGSTLDGGASWTTTNMSEQYFKQYGRNSGTAYTSARKSDIFVINMATNSYPTGSNLENYTSKAKAFVASLKQDNPNIKVVFCYGAMTQYYMDTNIGPNLQTIVSELGGDDSGVYLMQFGNGRDGSGGHPSVANHKTMSRELVSFLKEKGIA